MEDKLIAEIKKIIENNQINIIDNIKKIFEKKDKLDKKKNKLDKNESKKNIFDFIECTDNYDDKILVGDVNKYLKPYFTLSEIKETFLKIGIKSAKSNSLRYYRYIKFKI